MATDLENIRTSLRLLSELSRLVDGVNAMMRQLADSFDDPEKVPQEVKAALAEHGVALAECLDKAADSLALAWQETKRASNAVWVNTPAKKPQSQGETHVV